MKTRSFLLGLLGALPGVLGAQTPPDISSPSVPAWASDVVWYQIFPDRFRDGDLKNEPTRDSLELPIKPGPDWRLSSWTADWYARAPWEQALGKDFYRNGVLERRYGGDVQGILDKLGYLSDLGVNALYFNPLFYARSLHKYDGSSYHHIDPYFGPDPKGDFALIDKETSDPKTWQWTSADKLFLKLVKEAHAKGMKVIIDGVFNHTGRDFFAFKNLLEKQQDSPYKDWYKVTSFDDPNTIRNEFSYEGWWGYKSLPVFASAKEGKDIAAGPKEYIWNATKRWMDPDGNGNPADGVDGWRLDAADERPVEFWAEWNAYVRTINPNAYTTAEVWKNPSDFIYNGGFSAVMNYYGFAIPVKGWLADDHLTPTRFERQIDDRRAALPRANAFAMQNLMDSHDTDRLVSMIANGQKNSNRDPEQTDYNANNEPGQSKTYSVRKPSERDRAIQRLVVLMQMGSIGAPMIYYGDEAGMWGAHDPDDRQPMTWPDQTFEPQTIDPRTGSEPPQPVGFDKDVFAFYKSAVTLRRIHPALCRGNKVDLVADDKDDTLAFARSSAEDLIVAFNRSDAPRVVTVNVPPTLDRAGLAKAKVLFSTNPDPQACQLVPVVGNDTMKISLAPLSGVVVGAVP